MTLKSLLKEKFDVDVDMKSHLLNRKSIMNKPMKMENKYLQNQQKIQLNIRLSEVNVRMCFELLEKLLLIIQDLLVLNTENLLKLIDVDSEKFQSKLEGKAELLDMSVKAKIAKISLKNLEIKSLNEATTVKELVESLNDFHAFTLIEQMIMYRQHWEKLRILPVLSDLTKLQENSPVFNWDASTSFIQFA